MLKWYSLRKALCEDNTFTDCEAGIAIKAGNPDYTIRRNIFDTLSYSCVSGNMNAIVGVACGGDIHHNAMLPSAQTVNTVFIGDNRIATIAPIYVFRNTIVGRITLLNQVASDGPYTFSYNVIQNNDGAESPWQYIFDSNSPNANVVPINNLTGASGLVDSSGNLTGANVSYRGSRGWEIP